MWFAGINSSRHSATGVMVKAYVFLVKEDSLFMVYIKPTYFTGKFGSYKRINKMNQVGMPLLSESFSSKS